MIDAEARAEILADQIEDLRGVEDIEEYFMEVTDYDGWEALLIELDNPSSWLVFHSESEALVEIGGEARRYIDSSVAETIYHVFF